MTINEPISCNAADVFYLKSTQSEVGHSKDTIRAFQWHSKVTRGTFEGRSKGTWTLKTLARSGAWTLRHLDT